MTDHGLHDSLVWKALARLPAPVEQRAQQQLVEFFVRSNVPADVQHLGVHVAPCELGPLVDQLDAEADRLFELDDPIAAVFDAWSESVRLAVRVWEMDPENIE